MMFHRVPDRSGPKGGAPLPAVRAVLLPRPLVHSLERATRLFAMVRPRALRQAARMTVAAVLAYLGTAWLGLPEGYWAVITCLIVVPGSLGATLNAGISRAYGTVVGALLGGAGAWVHAQFGLPAVWIPFGCRLTRDHVLPLGRIVAALRQQIGDPPVDRRANHGPLQIDARLIQIGQSLLVLRPGRNRLGFVDLLLFRADCEIGKCRPPSGLALGVPHIRLRLQHRRFVQPDDDGVVGRVDHQQRVALVHQLVGGNGQSDNAARDLWRHCHNKARTVPSRVHGATT